MGDESVGLGLFLLLGHNKTLFQRLPESLTKHGGDVHAVPWLSAHVNQGFTTLCGHSELVTSRQVFDQIIALQMIRLLGRRPCVFQPHARK